MPLDRGYIPPNHRKTANTSLPALPQPSPPAPSPTYPPNTLTTHLSPSPPYTASSRQRHSSSSQQSSSQQPLVSQQPSSQEQLLSASSSPVSQLPRSIIYPTARSPRFTSSASPRFTAASDLASSPLVRSLPLNAPSPRLKPLCPSSFPSYSISAAVSAKPTVSALVAAALTRLRENTLLVACHSAATARTLRRAKRKLARTAREAIHAHTRACHEQLCRQNPDCPVKLVKGSHGCLQAQLRCIWSSRWNASCDTALQWCSQLPPTNTPPRAVVNIDASNNNANTHFSTPPQPAPSVAQLCALAARLFPGPLRAAVALGTGTQLAQAKGQGAGADVGTSGVAVVSPNKDLRNGEANDVSVAKYPASAPQNQVRAYKHHCGVCHVDADRAILVGVLRIQCLPLKRNVWQIGNHLLKQRPF